MKTSYLKMNWLFPVLGITVVAGTVLAARTYLDVERRTHAEETLTTTIDRLYQDHQLSAVLKSIHDGQADAAARRLDMILCGNILRLDAESASADARTRGYVQDAFQRMALVRPKTANGAMAGSAQECNDDRAAAEKILTIALASARNTQTK